MAKKKRTPWYIGGLHFECQGCGGCCSGPGEGYIWATRAEIELIADFLEISIGELKRDYLKRVGLRTTIIEHDLSRDCIFLCEIDGGKKCSIYAVRPSQCRNWPFWPNNLAGAKAWNEATRKCPGVNRGKLYSREEIDRIKKSRKWWQGAK
ncbi:MAG: YkgJ family cysteine cluster protein [Phycisphaerae bacterium]|nr:YkgJ family cysteine cluster protein [Phycisphaerae bacterium]